MKKMVFDRYGRPEEVLELRDVPTPEPGGAGILVRIRAAALNPYDWHHVTGLPYFMRLQTGLRRSRLSGVGADLAGVVEAAGPKVTRFRVGDEVFGRMDELAGSTLFDIGAVAEYVRVSEHSIRPLPEGTSAEEAAGLAMAGTTALWAMRDAGDVQPGQRVLVNGASGGVGTLAVQIAKARGAEVTGVCSTGNVDLVRSLGADHVVDYTREDFTTGALRYDVVLDNVGNRSPSDYRRILKHGGLYLASFDHPHNRVLGPLRAVAATALRWLPASQRVAILQPGHQAEDLETLAELVESGRLHPVVDRTFAIADTVAAFEYLATRRARGKVVIVP